MIKQVIILRTDLNMNVGKMVSQGAHASEAATLVSAEGEKVLAKSPYLDEWLNDKLSTKIVVEVKSHEKLLNVYQKAIDAGLLCSLIKDNTLQRYTSVAIGPAPEELINPITKRLRLLK